MGEDSLVVTFDKSHIVTIGQKLYAESVDLVRELVNNAYDADATRVTVTLKDDEVLVEDDGAGMDLEGLRQYLTIGSREKRDNPVSPRFGRQRIGEFGIGKFASLAAADHFEVTTQKDGFAATVVFDRAEWEKAGGNWELPLRMEAVLPWRRPGTRVRLSRLRRPLDRPRVEAKLIESAPIQAPNFAVYVNGRRIRARSTAGARFPFLEGTAFGTVHGEVRIATHGAADTASPGIEVKVKMVTVRRDLFGLDPGSEMARGITGEVHADFLAVTSDRSDLVRDTEEWEAFRDVMARVMDSTRQRYLLLADRRRNRAASRRLTDAIRIVEQSLRLNPDLAPRGALPVGEEGGDMAASEHRGAVVAKRRSTETDAVKEEEERFQAANPPDEMKDKATGPAGPGRPRQTRPRIRRLSPTAVARKVRMGGRGVSCVLEHCGPEEPEAFTEGNVICINRDHALYVRNAKSRRLHLMHLARLLAQEIVIMQGNAGPREAFERQSRLLRDAVGL